MLASCGSRKRSEKLVSYILPPEEGYLPGKASVHPSTCTECPAGCGLLVKVRDGWPIKLEGAPGHPVNDGALCLRVYRVVQIEDVPENEARNGPNINVTKVQGNIAIFRFHPFHAGVTRLTRKNTGSEHQLWLDAIFLSFLR